MNSEWREVRVGDLGHVVTGKTPKTAIAENYGGSIPFLTPSDDMSIKHVESTNRRLTARGLSEVKNCLLPPRSICVSCIGSDLGKAVMTTRDTVTNQQINSIIPADNVDPDFVYYAMLILGKELNYISKTSTAVPIVNKSSFSSYSIKLPDFKEQKAISSVLTALDARIAENRKINHHLEQIAQAIFKSWFIDFEPWGGVMPDNWRITTLGDVTTPIRTKVGNRTFSVFSAVTTGNLVLSDDYFTKQVYSKDIGKYIVVEPNDFSYNPARVNIGSIGINDFEFAGCVSPVYVVFRSELEYHHFLSFVIKTPNFQEEVRTRASGSVRQSMNYSDFALIETVYPSLDVIRDFNYQYEKIVEVIKQKEVESRKLSETRDALLPRLMSGELSVADV